MNILSRILKSSFWVLSTRLIIQVIQFGVTIILARLLTPADFGLIAMVSVVLGFLSIFITIGFSQGIIQKQDTNDDHLQTTFFVTLLIGIFLFLLGFAAAPIAASFFGNQDIVILLRISIIGFLVGPFASVPQAMLTKKMKFYELSKINALSALVSFAITLSMVFLDFGVISIVVGSLAGSIVTVLICFLYFPWLPKFRFSKYAFDDLFGFSSRVFGTNAVEYFSRNLDNSLIGKYLGAASLGFYNLSYNLMMLPLQNIAFPIRSVLLPAFSEVQNNQKETIHTYCDFLALIAAVVFPATFGLFSIADLFIPAAYGQQWIPAIPLLQVLCLSGMMQAIAIPNNSILLSIGRSDLVLKLSLLNLILYACGFVVGLAWGAIGVATGYTIANLIAIPISFVTVSKIHNLPVPAILKTILSPLVGSILMTLLLKAIVLPLLNQAVLGDLLRLIGMIVLGALFYLAYSKLFLSKQWQAVISTIKPLERAG